MSPHRADKPDDALPLSDYQDEVCPACGAKFTYINKKDQREPRLPERFCTGGSYGFLWLRKCAESRPHVHQRCWMCNAEWIVAPKFTAAFVRST